MTMNRAMTIALATCLTFGFGGCKMKPKPKLDPKQNKSLMKAYEKKDIQAFKQALEAGADPNVRDRTEFTILSNIALDNPKDKNLAVHLQMVELLIDYGVDVNTYPDPRSGYSKTPIMKAAENGNTELIKSLINAKADLKLKSQKGLTAFEIAKKENHPEIAEMIKDAGGG